MKPHIKGIQHVYTTEGVFDEIDRSMIYATIHQQDEKEKERLEMLRNIRHKKDNEKIEYYFRRKKKND